MKLYRHIDPKAHDAYDGSYTGGLPDPISFLVDDGMLVVVEPDATLRWCFVHNARISKWISGLGCCYQGTKPRSCETGTALIVRTEG